MRLLATADLHYNHTVSRPLADRLIEEMNGVEADVLVVIGDTASADGEALERCLERFRFAGPKLFVTGNHELWTHGPDSYAVFKEMLPPRVRAMGWHWLEGEPFVAGDVAIVGSAGWYDYSFAQEDLRIPRRFYEHKIAPGAVDRLDEYRELLVGDDVPEAALQIAARWNDGAFVKLHRSDEQFLDELLATLERSLEQVASKREVVAAIHQLPFRELLPPPRIPQWDFAKAYLGSERIGRLLLRYPNVRHVICGHSHLALEAKVGHIHAINIGSGYRWKTYRVLEL
jgi:Icc-related predicted phosphoesterase